MKDITVVVDQSSLSFEGNYKIVFRVGKLGFSNVDAEKQRILGTHIRKQEFGRLLGCVYFLGLPKGVFDVEFVKKLYGV